MRARALLLPLLYTPAALAAEQASTYGTSPKTPHVWDEAMVRQLRGGGQDNRKVFCNINPTYSDASLWNAEKQWCKYGQMHARGFDEGCPKNGPVAKYDCACMTPEEATKTQQNKKDLFMILGLVMLGVFLSFLSLLACFRSMDCWNSERIIESGKHQGRKVKDVYRQTYSIFALIFLINAIWPWVIMGTTDLDGFAWQCGTHATEVPGVASEGAIPVKP